MLVGGAVFGAGMVLAGGCISGALYKSGAGNLNSMAALVGIPIGIALIEYGPLQGFHRFLKHYTIKSATGGPVTLPSLTGLSYGTLAVVFGAITVAAAAIVSRRKKPIAGKPSPREEPHAGGLLERIITRPWKPWQSGILIGLLACGGYVSSAASGRNYPLGVTHGVLYTQLLLTDYPLAYVCSPSTSPGPAQQQSPTGTQAAAKTQPAKKVSVWLILEVVSLVIGAFFSARLTGRGRLLPKPPDETLVAFFGGIITGAGAGIAGYCVVGGIMSGWALMSVASLIFGVTAIMANWVMTYLYLMGGTLRG